MEQNESNVSSVANAVPRSRLGKGLGALLGGNQRATPPATSNAAAPTPIADKEADIRRLPVDAVSANPYQPRRTFDQSALQTLAVSLKANGLVQPIVVIATEGGYQLVAGERRLRAAKLAGLTEVPAIVRALDPSAQARLALIENIHREDLNPIDRAEGYQLLMQQGQLTQQALAELIGDQRATIANHLRLLDLADDVRDLVRDGRLSFGHAKVIAGLATDRQSAVAARCLTELWSVRQLESFLSTETVELSKPEPIVKRASTPHYDDLAQQLTRALGVRAQVQPGAKKGAGKVTLHYASLDQFDQLLTQLGVKLED